MSGNKILISWSGQSSRKVAIALSRFLKLTLNASEPWMSSKDIGVGSFWHDELWAALRSAKLGIACLTPENINSNWIHFEVGAIARRFGRGSTCPYLLQLEPTEIKGPLQHLQYTLADEEGTFRLVEGVNSTLRVGRLNAEMLYDSFHAHWNTFKNTLERVREEVISQRGVHQRIDLLRTHEEPKPSDSGLPAKEAARERFEALLRKTIMAELISRRGQTNTTNDPSPIFQLNRYTDAMLFNLLKAINGLNSIVCEEMENRGRVLMSSPPSEPKMKP